MQTMKMIDLFNDIAMVKKLPKTIIFDTETYHLNPNNHYVRECGDTVKKLENDYNLLLCLNDEVEIIEDKPNKINSMIINEDSLISRTIGLDEMKELLDSNFIEIANNFNTLATSVNYLLEKSDKSEK